MPEASKPNIHGCIHGRIAVAVFNPGGVEEINMLPLLLSFGDSAFVDENSIARLRPG